MISFKYSVLCLPIGLQLYQLGVQFTHLGKKRYLFNSIIF